MLCPIWEIVVDHDYFCTVSIITDWIKAWEQKDIYFNNIAVGKLHSELASPTQLQLISVGVDFVLPLSQHCHQQCWSLAEQSRTQIF